MDKVRAKYGVVDPVLPGDVKFQSPWIRFAQVSTEEALRCALQRFQSSWIRFARRKVISSKFTCVFQSPWIRFAPMKAKNNRDYPQGRVSIPVDKVRALPGDIDNDTPFIVSIPVDKVRAYGDTAFQTWPDGWSFNPRG